MIQAENLIEEEVENNSKNSRASIEKSSKNSLFENQTKNSRKSPESNKSL